MLLNRFGYVPSMVSPHNPFPGMNPFLQASWRDVHTRLVVLIAMQLAKRLPAGLVARTEERVTVGEVDQSYFPDGAVLERRARETPTARLQETAVETAVFTEPIIVIAEPETERWLEIRDRNGRLVTVIEVLSPTNKSEQGWKDYQRKQQEFLAAGVNLVEIDLIRGGLHMVAVPSDAFARPPGTSYIVCVARLQHGYTICREIYLCPLREPLPTIRVPFRANDPDAPLALQPLIDEIYVDAGYWETADQYKMEPPLPPDEAAWVEERLKAAGLK